MTECVLHHQACSCREGKFAAPLRAAEECAMELDHAKNAAGISEQERARLAAVVDATQEAIDQIRPRRMKRCSRADGGANCIYDACDECSSAVWEQPPMLVEAAHMFQDDLERFKEQETFALGFSVAVDSPEGKTVPLYRLEEETHL